MKRTLTTYFIRRLGSTYPDAVAIITGSPEYPEISGRVEFRQTPAGVLVTADMSGLPKSLTAGCDFPVLGLHIHEGGSCTGTSAMPFSDAHGHFNPNDCPHPYHAGDMPPLFVTGGYAWQTFLSGRFHVRQIVDRTVIVHSRQDDFTTQPSGNSGDMIACGVIRRIR